MATSRREFLGKSVICTLSATWLGTALDLFAQDAPRLLNYQGRLTDAAGQPRNGNFAMSFRIVDAGGASLGWAETQPGIVVNNGFFSVLLGKVTPLTAAVFTGPPVDAYGAVRFLEVTVAGETLAPNIRIVSAAWAIAGASGPTGAAGGRRHRTHRHRGECRSHRLHRTDGQYRAPPAPAARARLGRPARRDLAGSGSVGPTGPGTGPAVRVPPDRRDRWVHRDRQVPGYRLDRPDRPDWPPGPQGPTGPTGDSGAIGPQTGATGPTGPV